VILKIQVFAGNNLIFKSRKKQSLKIIMETTLINEEVPVQNSEAEPAPDSSKKKGRKSKTKDPDSEKKTSKRKSKRDSTEEKPSTETSEHSDGSAKQEKESKKPRSKSKQKPEEVSQLSDLQVCIRCLCDSSRKSSGRTKSSPNTKRR
jgi:hypothetical protein